MQNNEIAANIKKIEANKKQLIRLLISYNDFKNAYDIANLILEDNYQEKVESTIEGEKLKNKRIWESLNCAMVIGYNRPFSGNDKKSKNPIPDLPKGILKVFNESEKEIHKSLIENRNSFIAHSDSDAINMNPFYIKFNDKKIDFLIPFQNEARAPYLINIVSKIRDMCEKLMEEAYRRRCILEKELQKYIPIKEFGKDEFKLPFNRYELNDM